MSPLTFGYFHAGAMRAGEQIVHADPYFFPLDAVADWNRVYGRPGFLQHQCVIPKDRARKTLAAMLDRVAHRGSPSFLAVLKLMGADDAGLMAFPMDGYTLALDFPATPQSLALLDDLDRMVADAGGRLYLAKDARQSADMLHAGYPNLPQFRALRQETGAIKRFSSLQSERLGL
jgi:decaprenylphospho-beta-D-ribofuranose 2-oxidase